MVVGEVRERTGADTQPPPSQSTTPPAFPPVRHRKLEGSRFARSRRAEQSGSGAAQSGSTNVGPSGADLAARVPAPAPGSVEEESLAMLGSMTTDDVQEAQQELQERLKPETLAFLRKRALLKKAPAQGDPNQPPPPAVSAAPADRKPTAGPPATAAPASSAAGPLPTVARLRFDAQGLIIGLSPADAAPEDAVRRSPLGGEESMQADAARGGRADQKLELGAPHRGPGHAAGRSDKAFSTWKLGRLVHCRAASS